MGETNGRNQSMKILIIFIFAILLDAFVIWILLNFFGIATPQP